MVRIYAPPAANHLLGAKLEKMEERSREEEEKGAYERCGTHTEKPLPYHLAPQVEGHVDQQDLKEPCNQVCFT